ncbi:MAG: HAD-IIB family hydrolase [Methylophilaceae bacterium]
MEAYTSDKDKDGSLYILMISVHGLIRANDLELGSNADTGGQTKYVVELTKTLGEHPQVGKVDLLTRLIDDPALSEDYAQSEQELSENTRIVRLRCGPKKYIRKELLWKHLDQMVDKCLQFLRKQGQLPDFIHAHYADAGYVGRQLSNLLGIPLIFTGHSLGRPKLDRLLKSGKKESAIERQFNLNWRIDAEEDILHDASLVVTSTRQEIDDQYGMYRNHNDIRYRVIPPGIDTSRFSAPTRGYRIDEDFKLLIDKFIFKKDKPIILTICRPDLRKNISGLITAYGQSKALQEMANLVIVAGTREDINDLEESQQKVMNSLLLDIDKYDLWGKVAIPKNITQDDIPELYRYAAKRKGVFINAAFTEPFGLTLIEATASGLPFIAPDDGGPRDIVSNCRNGFLTNTLDSDAIAESLQQALSDPKKWRLLSKNGLNNIKRHYTWHKHVEKYMKEVRALLHRDRKRIKRQYKTALNAGKSTMPLAKAALITDIDNTLLGDYKSLQDLVGWLRNQSGQLAFGIATGRPLESAVNILKEHNVPMPDVLITSVGSEINYGVSLKPDTGWINHIKHLWRRDDLIEAMKSISGIRLQTPENQRDFKISYLVNQNELPPIETINQHLQQLNLKAQVIYSHNEFLDILPIRASKGHAIRYLAYKWDLPLKQFLTSGDSGNDSEMLIGDTLGVVVGNHSDELETLRGLDQVYFAESHYAAGILEGIQHYQFGQTNEN